MKKILIVLAIAISCFFSTAFAIQQEMKIAFSPYEIYSPEPVSFDMYSHTFPAPDNFNPENWTLNHYQYVVTPGIGFDVIAYDENTTYVPYKIYFADGTSLLLQLDDTFRPYVDPTFNIIVVECQYTAPNSGNRNAFCNISGKGK